MEYHFPGAKFYGEFICTEELVLNLISSLDVKKATGTDAISARMLKATAPSIVPSVTKVFNLSLATGRFSAAWKFDLSLKQVTSQTLQIISWRTVAHHM